MRSNIRCYQSFLSNLIIFLITATRLKKRFRTNYLIQNLIKYPLFIEEYIAAWIIANQSSDKCKPQAMPLITLNYIAYCFIA